MEQTKSKYIIGNILDILICVILFIMSLYKGAFYKEDSLFPNFVICIIGLGCLITKIIKNIKSGDIITKSKSITLFDSFVIMMPLVYILPIIFRTYASLENSIFECIRYINFAICYFIVRNSKNIKIYSICFIIIAILLSILGMDEITYRAIESLTKNISITYLSNQTNAISSTIQYANITAFIIHIGSLLMLANLYKSIPTLGEKKRVRASIFVGLQIFVYVFLQSALILTSSRMMTFLSILSVIALCIYYLINKDKNKIMMTIGLYVMSFLLVSTIDNLLINKAYTSVFAVYFALLLAIFSTVVIKHLMFINKEDKILTDKKINNGKNVNNLPKIKRKPIINIVLQILVFVIIISTIFYTKESIILDFNSKEPTQISRNIYSYKIGKNTLDIKNIASNNSKFYITIYEVNKDFESKIVYDKVYEDYENTRITAEFNLSKETKRVIIKLSIISGKIEFNSFKLNDKNIILSYAFLPDNMVFRFIDTINLDSNNSLRATYYKDAIKLFKESKIFGIGGEGFKLRYQEVQDNAYISSEVHSTPIQILVESGILGIISYTLIIIMAICLIFNVFRKNKDINIFIILIILISYIIFSTFDLTLSFGIMINMLGILIGSISNIYRNTRYSKKDRYTVDNKSWFSTFKIGTMSLFLILLILATIYSGKIYFASMIAYNNYESETPTLKETYEKVAYLEKKTMLDKYNYEYMILLTRTYVEHISNLDIEYINETDSKSKLVLKNEINTYVVKQKIIYDTLIEYEYYNKYALYEVASGYFNSFIRYSSIFKDNFESDEVAYSFYLEYAMKLTDRILDNAKLNEVAKGLAKNIYETYYEKLLSNNRYLNSQVITEVTNSIKQKLIDI